MSVYDRWHLSRPPAGAKTCGRHRGKVASAQHDAGLRWQVRGTDDAGRPFKQNFEFEDDAKDKDAELRAAKRTGSFVDDRAGKITFRDYAEQWRRGRMHDIVTAERVEAVLRVHAYAAPDTPGLTLAGGPALGDHQMRALAKRPSLLQQWIKGLKLHQNTILKVITDVSAVFAAAVEDGIIVRNPLRAKSVQKPKPLRTEAVPWTAGQIAAVAAALPARLEGLPYLGAACGLRQGELFAVSLEDLDFLRRTLRVAVQVKFAGGAWIFAPVKNKKARDVPVAAPIMPVLAEQVRLYPPAKVTLPFGRPDGKPVTRELLFTWPGSGAIKRTGFNPVWIRAWKAAGIPDRGRLNGCHVLRHTAASEWLSRGLNIAKVAAYLGDTVAVVSKTYAHFMPDDDDRARQVMDGFFSGLAERQSAPVVPSAFGETLLWLAGGLCAQLISN